MTTGSGLFVSLEGVDGCGKSTQLPPLIARLKEAGVDVVESAEPGGSRISRRIREVLLDPATPELSPTTELLLYFANRAQNVDEIIRPALERGAVVVTDRFTDSTLAYQGAGRGLGEPLVRELHAIACRGIEPALTLVLDLSPEASRARMHGRAPDRMEKNSDEFRGRVRAAYHLLAQEEPERVRLIDASGNADEVARQIWAEVEPRLRRV